MYARIYHLRKNKNLSQARLAERLGVSQTGYLKYETGKNDVPTDILRALAEFYDTSVDYMMGMTDVREPYPKRCREFRPAGGSSCLNLHACHR